MRLPRASLIIVCLLSFWHIQGVSQGSIPDVQSWVDLLSRKKPVLPEESRELKLQLLSLDSSSLCQVLDDMRMQKVRHPVHYKMRLNILEADLNLSYRFCPRAQTTDDLLTEALQLAYELEDEAGIFEAHWKFVSHYTRQGIFGLATFHAQTALEMAEAGKLDPYMGSDGNFWLSYILFHSREYEAAKNVTLSFLHQTGPDVFPEDSLTGYEKMNAWNTVGLCYEKLGKPDSAFMAFDSAMSLADVVGNSFWRGLIAGNMGDVYYTIGEYDKAEPLLKRDYEESKASGQLDNAANSLQWLARIDLHNGKPQAALDKAREATRMLMVYPRADYLEHTLYTYTQIFAALGMADSVNVYMHQYMIVHDSIEKAAHDNRAEIVTMRMDNQSYANTITALNKEKKRISLIRNFTIILLILIAAVGLLTLNRQKLKIKLRQQQALEEKRRAEEEAARAVEQLQIFTRHLREKTNLIENLQTQLLERELNEEQVRSVAALTQQTILTDEDWERFKILFETVHPGFFMRLKQHSTDITLAELRMAALCKLQVPPKEAANMLGISHNSVHKTRQRLRHRLGLDPDANLEAYFATSS